MNFNYKISKNCVICNKVYYKRDCESKLHWSKHKYCSIQCQHKGLVVRPLYFKCLVCGKKKRRHSCQKTPKYCSNKCFVSTRVGVKRPKFSKEWLENLSKSHIGVQAKGKHPKWKGGITPENHAERNKFREYIQKKVLKRDNYTCQICGKRGGLLHVDHIQEWVDYVDLRFSMDNCRTLCRECHYFITFKKPMPKWSKWGDTRNLHYRLKQNNI